MKKEKKTDRISTFIGSDASIDGTIDFKGTIRVDGKVKGKIVSNGGTVVVGEKAAVDAELYVNVAVVMGEVNGTIDAQERIEVYPPGRVGGNIQAPVISIEPGGIFNGSCKMKPPKEAAGKTSFFSKAKPAAVEPKDSAPAPESNEKPAFTELKSS
ncbi:MAG: polymer-forming cytoskeletal protein [Desulfobacterales bacterium]|nr:MAG: polymer-forming cytoskeletal protein [Desulfobacterales bacterium]